MSLFDFYSFDTSAILNGRRDLFPPGPTFDPLWEGVEEMIAAGQVRAVDEVRRELARKDDDAHRWARGCKGLFVPLRHDIQRSTRAVLAAHPELLGKGGSGPRNAADPFVIALAQAEGGTVVTQEQPRNLSKPRIPDVCDALGVPWMTLPKFFEAQGWTMVRR